MRFQVRRLWRRPAATKVATLAVIALVATACGVGPQDNVTPAPVPAVSDTTLTDLDCHTPAPPGSRSVTDSQAEELGKAIHAFGREYEVALHGWCFSADNAVVSVLVWAESDSDQAAVVDEHVRPMLEQWLDEVRIGYYPERKYEPLA